MAEPPPFPFVVGCGRSGTTLVRAILDAHPEMAVPFESHFPVWFARNRARYERNEGFATETFLDDLLAHESFRRWGLDADQVREALVAAAPTAYPDAIRATFAAYAAARAKPRYGDKTPIFVVHIPLLARMFPEAVFVHIVRDGQRPVALSRVETAWGTNRFEHEALLWSSQVRRGRADGAALGPTRYREMYYEELVESPEKFARDLCAFVDLDYDPAMLEYHLRASSVLDDQPFPDEHRNLRQPPSKDLRDWRAELTHEQVALFEALAGQTLTDLGYERVVAAPPTSIRARALAARARYEAAVGYKHARTVLWRATHRQGGRSLRGSGTIRRRPAPSLRTEDAVRPATAADAGRLRHRVTRHVPLSVRRWPYQAADRVAGVLDGRRLRADCPEIAAALTRHQASHDLRAVYDRYVADVSRWDWAVSWPTACVLEALCEQRRPRRILDLGSGFSTYVECNWARRAGLEVEVVSVDDSPEWLETTRTFLAGNELAADLVAPDALDSQPDQTFDLVFLDAALMETRASFIPMILRTTAPGGILLLDDMNVRGYRAEVRALLDRAGWSLYSLRANTVDARGRFAMLTVAPAAQT